MSESEEYDSDSSRQSETTSDEEISGDFGYWNPGFSVYRRKRMDEIISEEEVLETADTNRYKTDKIKIRHHAQIENNNTDYPARGCDNKNGSGSTEWKATINQTKFTEIDNIWTDPTADKDRKSRHSDSRKRKTFKLSQGFLTKIMILSLAIGRCISAKSIDGLTLKNEIKQEHAPGSYGINHNEENDVKIEEELIKAYNCEEGGTANA